MPAYSLLVTSCDRDDLLERTIKTFIRTCDISPSEIVIINDGPDRPCPAFLNRYKHLRLKWICNGERRGQIYSCDRLWIECKNDFAMWMEEDWAFTSGDFIKKSFDILEHPEVLTVSLRGTECNGHPLVNDPRFPFKIQEQGWRGGWGNFSFNPGLRRKADWERIGSYGRQVGYGTHGLSHELALSKMYREMGFVIAVLPPYTPYVVHTGGGRSRAIEPLRTNPPKVLIAVPACHRFDYGPWESGESPHFNLSKAWEGKPYGTDIHISGDNPRISAVRETWARDVANHKNATMKFFYGHGPNNQPLKEDEVRLSVPDDYGHLPQKTIAICQWALDNGFEYTLKCDDDSYVYVDRAMTEVCQFADFAGYINGGSCSGGCGYWLSRRAMEVVVKNPIGSHWAEDVTVGMIMKSAGISPVNLPSHKPGFEAHWFMPDGFDPKKITPDIVCAHAVQPEVMREWYHYEQTRHSQTTPTL